MEGFEVGVENCVTSLFYAEGNGFLNDRSELFLSVDAAHLQSCDLSLQILPCLALLEEHVLGLFECSSDGGVLCVDFEGYFGLFD